MQERHSFERELSDLESSALNTLAMRKPRGKTKPESVKARILWPALGFPAVIAPHEKPSDSPFAEGDATRCICVLVLTNKRFLSTEEAAWYLRCVPWAERNKRHIPSGQAGSFREEELAIRNEDKQSPLVKSNPTSALGGLVGFGGDDDRRNRIVANLAHRVRNFYQREGLQFLQEIRVYESAVGRFGDGLYHLFWNNELPNEQAPSDEMALLLRAFAPPRRNKLGKLWQELPNFLMNEYEFEYGALHDPYKASARGRCPRAEILHPLFIQRRPLPTIRVGHLTDTHVHVRADVYEENLRQSRPELKQKGITAPIVYDNWNTNFVRTYNAAKEDSDVILLTGDLIDYGRGHFWKDKQDRHTLGEDGRYHVDRNWFLFYFLLASGDAYKCPVYTILGNHDWRLNPYPPFAEGAPMPPELLRTTLGLSEDQQKEILRIMHGPGHEPEISYNRAVDAKWKMEKTNTRLWPKYLQINFTGKQNVDIPGVPTETNVESVAWYLLTINPFLDYWFTLPAGQKVLMLDWAKNENLLFGDLHRGKRFPTWTIPEIKRSANEGPKARSCLTDLQAALVWEFTEMPGAAKIIGIHAPPIGPWNVWNDAELWTGWKTFDRRGKGYPFYTRKTADGKSAKGHPLFAIRPAKGVLPDAVEGMDASFGSFESKRADFIRRVADPQFGIRLVLAGHIHRKGMFAVYKAPASWGSTLQGELLIQGVMEKDARALRAPAATTMKIPGAVLVGPLYVNGTSVGPRGNAYPAKGVHGNVGPGYAHIELSNDGTIQKAVFRWVRGIEPSTLVSPEREVGVPMW